jgi:drug/metabolite transporter (DMT)-like permease
LPWALAVNLLFAARVHVSAPGIALAAASGMLASALGYTVWYAAPRLSAITAGTVQLSVPVIAALGGSKPALDEQPTRRLIVCGVAILGGIALVARQRSRPASA